MSIIMNTEFFVVQLYYVYPRWSLSKNSVTLEYYFMLYILLDIISYLNKVQIVAHVPSIQNIALAINICNCHISNVLSYKA